MSCFDVQILDPNINTVEIETCIGDQPSSINIITYDNTNILEINNCIALLPSEINDLIIVKNILAGSGIAVISSSGIYTISLNNPNLISSDISDFLESVQDIIGQSGLNTGDYVNLNYNDITGLTTISVTGLQPSGNYSVVGHTHTSNNITDFTSSVSGLLPSITGVGQASSSFLNNVYSISVTGLQPSGNYSLVGHTHTSSNITDFNSSVSGLLPVKNISAGSGIGISSASGDFTVSVTGSFGLTSEEVDDRVSNLLVAGNYVNLNYNDSADILTVSVTGVQPSGNYSIIGHSHAISDVSGLQNALDSKQPSGNYANFVHVHTSSDITDFNSSVSGLLPVKNIIGSGYVNISSSSGNFTVSVNGLQPSGSYADLAHTHTSSQITDFNTSVSGLLASYATINSPNFSGIPTAPTATSGTNNSQIANTQFVRTEISNLVNSAPSTLDTLNELATALGNDPNFATTVTNSLASKAALSGAIFTGPVTIPSGTGNFNSLTINGINVSVSGHTHTSSNITDFNSGVSGLLPAVAGSGYVISNFSNNIYTISVTGLQPSGNYSVVGHNHTTNDIINFASGVSDSLTTALLGGSFINLTYDSILDTLTINATGLQPSGNYSVIGHSHASSDITDFNSSVSGLLPVKNVSGAGYVNVSSVSGNYTVSVTGLQPSGNYSLIGHTHVTSDITNFASGVSGLLPNVTGIGYVTSNFSNNTYSIGVTGLQPSGNYSLVGHSHTSNNITDFNSSVSGLLPVKNLTAGSGIGISSLSGDFTISVTGTFGLTSEEVDDRVNSLLVPGNYTNLNYNDNLNTLTISVTGVQPSGNYSITGHSHVIADVSGLQNALDNKQPSGSYASLVHSHVSSDITNFNSSVSGLLPVTNILPGVGINVYNASGIYTIEATGSGILSDQAKSLVTTVFNKTGSPIPKMTAVYINGGQGDLPTVSLAIATSDMTSAGTYGLTYETIPNMQSGQVIVFGVLTGLNTDQFNPTAPQGDVNGSVLYLSPSVSGSLTLTKPSAPNHIVAIGTVVRTHQNEGVIEVRVQNGFELEELHNVAISGVTNGQFLQYNSSGQLWVPSSSGNFNTLSINGTGVSVNGHTHISSNITDFSSSVNSLVSGVYAPLSGALNQFSNTSSSQLASIITDETGTGVLVFNNSPNFSGIPTVPTASSGTNTNQIASTSFVRTEISNLVGSAPSTLDTLNELAAALGNDANFSTTITNSLAGKANLNGASFTGPISGPSGNFVILKQNGTDVSVNGHTHTSSNITDFASSVSGLLPVTNITGGSNITVSQSGTTYTVAVTGSLGLTTEEVDDRVANLLVAGSGIILSYDDNANTLQVSADINVVNGSNLYLWSSFR